MSNWTFLAMKLKSHQSQIDEEKAKQEREVDKLIQRIGEQYFRSHLGDSIKKSFTNGGGVAHLDVKECLFIFMWNQPLLNSITDNNNKLDICKSVSIKLGYKFIKELKEEFEVDVKEGTMVITLILKK